jgi:hypothetical protein
VIKLLVSLDIAALWLPVFRVRLLAESLEEAAGFKAVSAVTPASG